jgi:hypothetical protein
MTIEISKNKICAEHAELIILKVKSFCKCCNLARFQVMDHGIALKCDAFVCVSILAGEHEMNSLLRTAERKPFHFFILRLSIAILACIFAIRTRQHITAATDR